MRTSTKLSVSMLFASVVIHNAYGHMVMMKMYGDSNGLTGKGFGVTEGTPRDKSTRDPAQLDSPFVREYEIQEGIASQCGRTILEGKMDIPYQLEKAEDGGLPNINKDGTIKLIAHQVNEDGGGPYTCAVDTEAKGERFQDVPVTVNVPGTGGKSNAKATDFMLQTRMPQGAKCTGGADGETCILRCLNSAESGPYGGCIAFTQKLGLFNDPAPAGKGPSAGFQLDKITENPVSREPDMFSDARSKLKDADIQPGAAPQKTKMLPAPKGKRRSLSRRQKNNGGNGGKLPGYMPSVKPTDEGIMYEIYTGPLGQADVPQNVRKSLTGGKKRSVEARGMKDNATAPELRLRSPAVGSIAEAHPTTNSKKFTEEEIKKAEEEEREEDEAEEMARQKPSTRL